jgi:hypothetical protein
MFQFSLSLRAAPDDIVALLIRQAGSRVGVDCSRLVSKAEFTAELQRI